MAGAVTITSTSRYIYVSRADGSLLSRHLTVEDAIEAAVNAGLGEYRIQYPDRKVVVSKVYGTLPSSPAPAAPTALTLEEVTAGYASLSWTDDGNGTSWTVYRDGTPIGTATSAYYTDSTVVPSTLYSYQVQASNSTGSSALSDALPVTTSANSLPEWGLTDQSGTIGAAFSLDLNTVCGDVDGHARTYTLVSGSVPGLSLASPNYSGTPTTAGAYPLTFRANDGYGTSDVSITFSVYDPDVTAPTVPANVSASANGSTVTVTWTASTDASGVSGYKVYRDGAYRASDTASPYVESGVPIGTYTYSVSAVDSSANANESAQSSAAVVTVVAANPDTPINFTAVSDGATTINLSWAAGPNGPVPDDYDLDFSATSASGPWTAITFVGTATTYAHTGRTAGVTYYYRVRAGLGALESGYAAVSATAPLSDTPDYVDPIDGVTRVNQTTVTLTTTGTAGTAELNAAIAAATNGTTIQLLAGTYPGAVTLNKDFSAANALIIKGAANFASIATGTWTVTGARQIVTGIDFDASTVRINLRGMNNHIVGNKFRRWTTSGVISVGNNNTDARYYNEVAYNEIGPCGIVNDTTSFRWGIKGSSGTAEASVAKHTWVHHNWFRDYNVGSSNRRGDAIEAGETGNVSWANTLVSGWYVEDNVITNAQLVGEALFDIKYGGSVIRRNTVDAASSDCKIQARMGTNSILESNYMASGVVQSSGQGHKLVGNFGQVRVLAGEDEYNVTTSNLHHRSYQVLAAKNVGTLRVGYVASSSYILPALDTTIEEQASGVTLDFETGTVDRRNSPASYQCTPAVAKTSTDVGPSAIATVASVAYKAARGL